MKCMCVRTFQEYLQTSLLVNFQKEVPHTYLMYVHNKESIWIQSSYRQKVNNDLVHNSNIFLILAKANE